MEEDDGVLAFYFNWPNKSFPPSTVKPSSPKPWETPWIINTLSSSTSLSGSSNTRAKEQSLTSSPKPTTICGHFGPEDFPIIIVHEAAKHRLFCVSLWWRGENVIVYMLRGRWWIAATIAAEAPRLLGGERRQPTCCSVSRSAFGTLQDALVSSRFL